MPTVRGKASVRRYFADIPVKMEGVLRGAARAGGKVLADEVAHLTPSGEVRENLRIRTKASDGRIVVTVDVKPGWARSLGTWLEYGTSGHFIRVHEDQDAGRSLGRINQQVRDAGGGERAASLVIGGKFVGGTVWHPGADPRPAFRPALDIKGREAVAAAQGHINSRVRRSGIVSESDAGDDA